MCLYGSIIRQGESFVFSIADKYSNVLYNVRNQSWDILETGRGCDWYMWNIDVFI